jgi:hypothetical protein|uniref:Uncharacterized protein n=1 Tax=viral metagenome TaxID=1070528 RepID=A0A6C0IV79_9ZZZZ
MTTEGNLTDDGFIIFRDILPSSAIDEARAAMTDPNVDGIDYMRLQEYIYGFMIKSINTSLNWNADFVKYRASDGNNSADASVWHRDVFSCNSGRDMVPSHTLLSYLDIAHVNVLVGSHKNMSLNLADALVQLITKKKTIEMHPGDLMLFNSGLIHCGIFVDVGQNHRRLIQVFEVYPSRTALREHDRNVLHIKQWSKNQMLQTLSRFYIIISVLNFFTYLTVSTGHGFVDCIRKKYYSSEGVRPRLTVVVNTRQPDNHYIMMHTTTDATEEETRRIALLTMEAPNVFYFSLCMVIVLCIVVYVKKTRIV